MKPAYLFILIIFSGLLLSCEPTTTPPPSTADINNTRGYQILPKLKGIWNGPVTSTTALGGYPEWIVDFRPISPSQISAKNELDTLNDINMSFFIALYKDQYTICFRNGGSFAGSKRISYFVCDSVAESGVENYYRFSEMVVGKNRAYCELIFRNNNDSLYFKTYTNQYNTLPNPVLHMTWSASRVDTTSCQPAVTQFSFPQKQLVQDFSTTFDAATESIFYGLSGDPYPEANQPTLGQTHATYSYAGAYIPVPSKKVFLIITTQPLITGFSFNAANLKYRSRYVILSATNPDFNFNYMHPGDYYLFAFYDADDNLTANSGDWFSLSTTPFNLGALGTANPTVQINFTIP
jgi:hypothetical protein